MGDLVNKGPDSAASLRLARSIEAKCVLGNHEAALLARGAFAESPPAKAVARCPDLAAAPDRVELGAYVASWPWIRDLGDILVVHAAVPPSLWQARTGSEAREDERAFALSTRYCDATGARPPQDWPPPAAPYEAWHRFYAGAWTVAYGHWARQGLHVAPRLRGLDSGCVYGKLLSAWIAEEDRIVQVPARRAYC